VVVEVARLHRVLAGALASAFACASASALVRLSTEYTGLVVCPKNAMPRPRHSRSDALRLPRTIRFIPRPGISVSSIAIVSPAELPAEGPAELPAEGPAEGPAELPAEGPAEGPAELHALHAHAQSGAEGPAAPCPPPPAVAPAAGSTTRPLRKQPPSGISNTAAAATRAWDTLPFPRMPHAHAEEALVGLEDHLASVVGV
jgi:hypothetical protein